MSAVALISGGAAWPRPLPSSPRQPAPGICDHPGCRRCPPDTEAPARAVEGTFSYTQDALSSNAEISGVFCKAARHAVRVAAHLRLRGRQGRGRHRGGPQRLVHGHRGRAGRRGGSDLLRDGLLLRYQRCRRRGAIANAEVEGVSLETLVQMACA